MQELYHNITASKSFRW